MAGLQPGFEGFGGIGTRIDARRPGPIPVIPGLVPGIHTAARLSRLREIPGTSPGMTKGALGHDKSESDCPALPAERADRVPVYAAIASMGSRYG